MKRRVVFGTLGVGGLAVVGWPAWKHWPDQGIWNPCRAGPLPPRLAKHELMKRPGRISTRHSYGILMSTLSASATASAAST